MNLAGSLRDRLRSPYFRFVGGILLITVIWIALTTILFSQSLSLTVKSARPFLYYSFALWGLVLPTTAERQSRAIRYLAAGGLAESILVTIGFFGDLTSVMPGLAKVMQFTGAHGFYRTITYGYAVIYLSFFLFFYCRNDFSRVYRTVGLSLTGLATIFVGYRTYWLAMLLAVAVLHLQQRERGRRHNIAWGAVIAAAVGVLVVVSGAVGALRERVEIAQYDIESGRGSISTRVGQVKVFLKLVENDTLLGLGFLHPDGPMAVKLHGLQGLQIFRFGTSDVGWLDLYIKFGIGGCLLLVFLAGDLLRSIRRALMKPGWEIHAVAGAVILMGIFAMPGSSLFSWSEGVLVVGLACGLGLSAAGRRSVTEEASGAHGPADSPRLDLPGELVAP